MGAKEREQLERTAREMTRGVANDPEGRYNLRKAFYDQYGYATRDGSGWGNSELAFLRWEINRGVLQPTEGPDPGSPWWREVNSHFIFLSTLAGLAFEAGELAHWPEPVSFWIDYIAEPNGKHWYRAHNRSILEGYGLFIELAKQENHYEQSFVNIVLYRLLFAQAMVEDATIFDDLGQILANPRLPAVELITQLPDFYPDHYPLNLKDYLEIEGFGWGLQDLLVDLMDRVLILPHLHKLYREASFWNHYFQLLSFIDRGRPVYPQVLLEAPPNDAELPQGPPPSLGPVVDPSEFKNLNLEKKMAKQKIAILGGGLSALSAAFDLTSYDNWQDQYDITLYQMGWRLGGKMRTGRGADGRDEELGLHLLIGFEQNLFDLLRACWDERTEKKLAPQCPYKTLDEAIVANNGSLFTEWLPEEYRWTNWPFICPVGPGKPCEGPPLTGEDLIKRGVALLIEMLLGSPYSKHFSPLLRWLLRHFFPLGNQFEGTALGPVAKEEDEKPNWFEKLWDNVEDLFDGAEEEIDQLLSRWKKTEPKKEASQELGPWLIELIPYLVDLLQAIERLLPKVFLANATIRHLAQAMSVGLAAIKGLIEDVYDPKTNSWDFSRIEDQDFRTWLKDNGCADYALFSPLVQFAYQGAFAGLAGGNDQGGLISAGTFLKTMAPAMGYKASFLYQPRLGTGDTLVMPIYQTLASRGVKFEFFSKVSDVLPGANGQIQEVQIQKQVTLKNGTYDPIKIVKGSPCWPASPLWEQIDDQQAKELKDKGIDLESPWADWSGVGEETLKLGQDFDQVILAIPAAAQKQAAKSLVAQDKRFADMIQGIENQAVSGVQFWYDKSLEEMGYHHKDWGMSSKNCLPNVITYQNPLFSFIDQTYIVENEAWASPPPKTLIMFAGYMPDFDDSDDFSDHQFPEREKQRLKELTWQWMMDNMGFFFKSDAPPAYPTGVDMENLRPLTSGADRALKYEEQWFSPIISPSDRYNLSVPGTNKWRIAPGDSGYGNLFLAGDWTDYGNNMGYMEGTVVSGYKSAQALLKKAFGQQQLRTFFEDPFFT